MAFLLARRLRTSRGRALISARIAQAGFFAWTADLPAASNYFGQLFSCRAPNFPHF
jgi:hypothetical protein